MKSITILVFFMAGLSYKICAVIDFALKPSHVQECLLTHHITIDDIKLMKSGKLTASKNITPGLKCFVKCVFNQVGALDGDHLVEENFLDYFEPHLGAHKTQQFYNLCKGEVDEGECATAFKIISCLVKNDTNFKKCRGRNCHKKQRRRRM